jgi:hypothetical protein
MRFFASMRSFLAGAGLFGVGLFGVGMAVGNALMASPAPPPARVHAGDTLAGFMPDEVMSLTYTTPWGRTTAQRSAPGASFQLLSTFAQGRPAQRCTASPQMTGRLADLSVLTARRALSLQEREQEFPVLLGVIEIRDGAISDPRAPVLAFANRTRTAVAVVLAGRAAEVALPVAELRWFETACEEIAQAADPGAAVTRPRKSGEARLLPARHQRRDLRKAVGDERRAR